MHKAAFLLLALAAITHAEDGSKPTSGSIARLKEQLSQQLREQMARVESCETLEQMWHDPRGEKSASHTIIVKLAEGIEVVTEGAEDEGYFTQKDYHLHENKVYALRVAHEEPCMDGKSKRMSESWFLLDGSGTPVHRSSMTARVPLGEDPDITEARNHSEALESTPPGGFEGWGAKLTARAYDLARTFRAGVGRYTFGDWDEWLLKGAPPSGSGDPPPRPRDWLPAADTRVLPVRGSTSPDGLFAIGWGYDKGPVDWRALAQPSEGRPGDQVMFSTKLAEGALSDDLMNDGNYLLNAVSGEPLAKLGLHYPGERRRFNHDELIARWSPAASCVVAIVTAKWESDYAHIAWTQDGRCPGSFDILQPLRKAATDAVLKSKHPAAKRLRKEEPGSFAFTLANILVEDDGSFEASVIGQVPKDDEPSGSYEVVIEGKFTPPDKQGSEASARLQVRKTRVLPPAAEG